MITKRNAVAIPCMRVAGGLPWVPRGIGPTARLSGVLGQPGVMMSDEEAKGILRAEYIKLRASGYPDLVDRLAGKQEMKDVVGLSGATYHLEVQGFWDDAEQRELRVVASIDDGVPRAFLPFTDSFTIDPGGTITEHSAA